MSDLWLESFQTLFVLAAILIIFTPALGSAFKGESRSYLGQPAVGWRVGRPPDPDARLNSPFFIRKNERKDGGGAALQDDDGYTTPTHI